MITETKKSLQKNPAQDKDLHKVKGLVGLLKSVMNIGLSKEEQDFFLDTDKNLIAEKPKLCTPEIADKLLKEFMKEYSYKNNPISVVISYCINKFNEQNDNSKI